MIQANAINSVYYTLLPTCAVALALLAGITIKPRGVLIDIIQALAAGILLACVATELLPQLKFSQHSMSLTFSILAGLALMLSLSQINPGCCSAKSSSTPLTPFVTGFSIEFTINGLVIVLAVLAGHFAALITAVSLAICCFVCGLSVTTRFMQVGFSLRRTLLSVLVMSMLFPIGGLLGLVFLLHLSGFWRQEIVAFGLAVILYVAIADLLLEGFKNNSAWAKIAFYFGFLLILIINAKFIG